jgi:hypothetical protein
VHVAPPWSRVIYWLPDTGMFVDTVSVDFNGIVLFDPDRLQDFYRGIPDGTDLFTRFVSTEDGDAALREGFVVPVLAIDDGEYDVVVRLATEDSGARGSVLCENGVFPFRVLKRAVVADLAVLKEWIPELGWIPVPLRPGDYAVTVRGYRELDPLLREITGAGYEFVLDPVAALPAVTGEIGRNMRVLRLD